RDLVLINGHVDVLDGVEVAIIEIQILDVELDAIGGSRSSHVEVRADMPPSAYLLRKRLRARMLMPSTSRVIRTAPAQARRFQSSKGLAAYWKMTTGRLARGAFMFMDMNWLLSAVNSSGAVSPEMRATASNTPVIMPERAAR